MPLNSLPKELTFPLVLRSSKNRTTTRGRSATMAYFNSDFWELNRQHRRNLLPLFSSIFLLCPVLVVTSHALICAHQPNVRGLAGLEGWNFWLGSARHGQVSCRPYSRRCVTRNTQNVVTGTTSPSHCKPRK